MTYEEVVEAIDRAKPGAFTRISYSTELPVAALYKNVGVRVIKETQTTTRLKVRYNNIAAVKERAALKDLTQSSTKPERKKKDETVISNALYYNPTTGKHYLAIFSTASGTHSHSLYYLMVGEQVICSFDDAEQIKHLVIPSYWTKGRTDTSRINIENIHWIGRPNR